MCEVIVCGQPPKDHNPQERNGTGICTCGGRLALGYGLAAGGCGTYDYCLACGRYWNAEDDDEAHE